MAPRDHTLLSPIDLDWRRSFERGFLHNRDKRVKESSTKAYRLAADNDDLRFDQIDHGCQPTPDIASDVAEISQRPWVIRC